MIYLSFEAKKKGGKSMWVLSWKKYSFSKLATFVSVIGALVRYAGVMCLVSSLIPGAIICIAIGVAFHFIAEAISFDKWKKAVRAKGYEQKIIQGDLDTAVQLYNGNIGKKTVKYFESLNPQVAQQIQEMINKNK